MEEITYSPGKLARKIGVNRVTLLNHLHETGLINHCFKTKYGHCRIPYSVAVRIASAEALAVPSPTPVTRRIIEVPRRKKRVVSSGGADDNSRQRLPEFPAQKRSQYSQVVQPDYTQIGKMLRAAGITMTDLLKYIEKDIDLSVLQPIPIEIPPAPFKKGGDRVMQNGQDMEVVHDEQSPYNNAKRDGNQTGKPPTSGNTSSDISNSSAK